MPYGIKYICEFDRIADVYPSYTLHILQKDFEGAAIRLYGGASAVVHSWDTDDPIAPIKGSSLEVALINEGQFPLTAIYSTDDEEFKARLTWQSSTDIVLFEGFIVQDDCSELMVDFNHEVRLAANDNLGLLKDVPLNKAAAGYDLLYTSTEWYEITQSGADVILLVELGYGSTVMVGDKISIDGGPQYEVSSIFKGGTVYNLYLVENPAPVFGTTGELSLYRNALDNLLPLLQIIKRCISATGLELNTHVFSTINESTVTENTVCFLEQTLIDPQTFLKDDTDYDDCYKVLTKILDRFNCTLFQAKGVWNIVRWHEARTYDYSVPGFIYDSDFVLSANKIYLDGRLTFDEGVIFEGYPKFFIGITEHTQPETGLIQRISRPYEFTKETFNYKQPAELLRNGNFTQLGTLRQTYTTGSGDTLQTISEYGAPWWYYTDAFPTQSGVNGAAVFFIRVIRDNLGNELDRYLVTIHNSIHSFRVEANAGDRFKYSFSFRALNNDSVGTAVTVLVSLKDGSQTKYICEPGNAGDPDGIGWKDTGFGWNTSVTGNVSDNFNSIEIESRPIPFDGFLYFYLSTYTDNPNDETRFKDVRLEYIPYINQSTKIIGQTHTSDHTITIKNNNEKEIFIDSSPRNSIAGALFLNEVEGVLQKRTRQWKTFIGTAMNLGQLTTFENLMLHKEARTILEGTFYGLISSIGGRPNVHDHVSLLLVCKYNFFPTRHFIFGRLEIDYRNNHFSGTLYELYKDNEANSQLVYNYTFEFLYGSQ